jgi:hypothetical protein
VVVFFVVKVKAELIATTVRISLMFVLSVDKMGLVQLVPQIAVSRLRSEILNHDRLLQILLFHQHCLFACCSQRWP